MVIILSSCRIFLPSCTPPMATRQNASTMGFISGIQLNGAWLKKPAAEATPRGWPQRRDKESSPRTGRGTAHCRAGNGEGHEPKTEVLCSIVEIKNVNQLVLIIRKGCQP